MAGLDLVECGKVSGKCWPGPRSPDLEGLSYPRFRQRLGHLVLKLRLKRLNGQTFRLKAGLRTLTPNLAKHPLNNTVARLQSFREFFWLAPAAFGHVGFAAAFATNDRRQLFDDLSGGNFLGEIV